MAAALIDSNVQIEDKPTLSSVYSDEVNAWLPQGAVERQAMKLLLEKIMPDAKVTQNEQVAHLLKAFPDLRLQIEHSEWRGDALTVTAFWQGTQLGSFPGTSGSPRLVRFRTNLVLRVNSGKVVHRWGTVDTRTLSRQLSGDPRTVPNASRRISSLASAMSYQGL